MQLQCTVRTRRHNLLPSIIIIIAIRNGFLVYLLYRTSRLQSIGDACRKSVAYKNSAKISRPITAKSTQVLSVFNTRNSYTYSFSRCTQFGFFQKMCCVFFTPLRQSYCQLSRGLAVFLRRGRMTISCTFSSALATISYQKCANITHVRQSEILEKPRNYPLAFANGW